MLKAEDIGFPPRLKLLRSDETAAEVEAV